MYGTFAGTWYFAPGSKSSSLRAPAARRPGTSAAAPTRPCCSSSGVISAGEDLPAPLVDEQAERQERDLLERLASSAG